MAERIQEKDADVLRPIGERQSTIPAVARYFAPLRKPLMVDWALKYHEVARPRKSAVTCTKPT